MAQKLKTHKGMQKRVKKTAKWKYLFDRSCNNHLLTNKGKSRKKDKYGKVLVSANTTRINRLLPYGN